MFKTLLTLCSVAGLLPATLVADPLEVGASAPDVSVKTDSGTDLNVAETARSGFTLVYFYPKADTPGCTAQACSLRDAYASLQDAGVQVIGVSKDSVEDQRAFKEKYELPFTLLADTDGQVVDAFGVPSRGRFASRQAFLFKNGELVWRDLKASTQKQAEDVKQALASL